MNESRTNQYEEFKERITLKVVKRFINKLYTFTKIILSSSSVKLFEIKDEL